MWNMVQKLQAVTGRKSLFILFIIIQGRGYPRIENDFFRDSGAFISLLNWLILISC